MPDYVIVGAGSAGCVLANRLTEDPDVTVTVLEAGPPDVKESIHVPMAALKLAKTDVDWDYSTVPEPELGGRRVFLPRGKTYGGSSALNNMIYIRGNPLDFDGWGVPGWTWDDLFPYFLRSEDNERGASAYHAVGGELHVCEGRSRNPMMQGLVEAMVEAGLPRNDDFNGAAQDGAGTYQLTQRNGMRLSAAVAFLHPVMGRPNLHVEPYVQVDRIVFEGDRAVGVVCRQLGRTWEVRAEREVLLCAGAYNSPQLLMLSGIGPAEHLATREVEVRHDLPEVGEGLTDHCMVSVAFTTDEPVSLLVGLEPAALEEFEASQSGPLTSNLAEAGGFARVAGGAPAPDIQIHGVPVQIVDEGTADPEAHGMWMSPGLLQPQSRGRVRLASNDPAAKPHVFHGYLTEEADRRVLVDGLRLVLEVARQPALRRYAAEPHTVPAGDDDAALLAHCRRHLMTIYHPVGTCAIGRVVDPELRVHGVHGLRVVDASVMPMVPRGNTNAPTIAIAERAADLIRGRDPERSSESLAVLAQ